MTDPGPPPPAQTAGAPAEGPGFEPPDLPPPEQLDRGTGSLRVRAARGVLINSAFRVGLSVVTLVRNVAVAAFLTADEYGLWALILLTVMTLAFLKQVGISSRYIQQNDPDQRLAFQRAFTVDLCYTTALWVVIVAALPLYALVYGRPAIILPGLVLSLVLLTTPFQAPVWVFYRRLQYFRQRCIEAIDPLLSTVVMITLAATLGIGHWALVIGALTGATVMATTAVALSPYPLRLRIDRRVVRQYLVFSWPVFTNGLAGLIVIQGILITGSWALGLAALGAIGLASNFARFSTTVELLVNRTLYPGICAAQDRVGVLFEVFEKANRVGLIWAVPFGTALALFAPDLVRFVLGPGWSEAERVLQVTGLVFAVQVFGFAWINFYMARGDTRPLAVFAAVQVALFLAVTMPLMIVIGLDGYIIAMAAGAIVQLAVRGHFLKRMFREFSMLSHIRRAVLPVLPAVGLVVLVRVIEGERTLALALAELSAFWLIVGITTYLAERELIREALGYLRSATRRGAASEAAAA